MLHGPPQLPERPWLSCRARQSRKALTRDPRYLQTHCLDNDNGDKPTAWTTNIHSYRRQRLHRKLLFACPTQTLNASERRDTGCIAIYSPLQRRRSPVLPGPPNKKQVGATFSWMWGESPSSRKGLPKMCVPGSGRPSSHKLMAAGLRAAELHASGVEGWCLVTACYVFKASVARVFAPGT